MHKTICNTYFLVHFSVTLLHIGFARDIYIYTYIYIYIYMIDSTVMGTKSGTLGIIKKCVLLCIYISTTHSLTSVFVYDFRKR